MQVNRHIEKSVEVIRSARVAQIEGMFDLASEKVLKRTWVVDIQLPTEWNIGLIVGPSGSGKTTIAKELFGDSFVTISWPEKKSIVDAFPSGMAIKDIAGLLSSVGLSSPPSWLKPFSVLSNGEQFRATMAATLAQMQEIVVMDEFTSVVDRTVAKIGSFAIQKAVRKQRKKFIAVGCHYDIAEWLEPDWIYEPQENRLSVGRSLRRPKLELHVHRVHHSAWELFRHHHYLNTSLNRSAKCFIAKLDGIPVAFAAILPLVHRTVKNTWREHRLVVLPDYQGVSIGNVFSEYVGSVLKANGKQFISTTSHPAMISHRNRSTLWGMTSKPKTRSNLTGCMNTSSDSKNSKGSFRATRSIDRPAASFKFVGKPLDDRVLAEGLFA